ncbi:MAG: rod shape-determining protein MreC [Candidatus Pacebacteria bacterium]|nr:rod shape-determining protein MreC [Candidatus Paceibacterota bacterium]
MKKRAKFLITAFLIIGLFVLAHRFFGDFFKNAFHKVSAPLERAAWKTGDLVSDVLALPFRLDNLRSENQQLTKQNLFLKDEIVRLKSLGEENAALRTALEFSTDKKLSLALTDVLSKDPQGNFLTLDKGRKDGLVEGLAVISADGALAGRLEKVFDNFSQALLITAKDNSFDIEIQSKEQNILAVAKGESEKSLSFGLVPQEAVIENGDLVKTTGLSGKFPKNIIVGEVAEFRKGDSSSFQQGRISPYFLKNPCNQLFVIINP